MIARLLVLLGCLVAALCASSAASAEPQKLLVYTSMKESMIGELKSAFAKRHPDIELDYQNGGTAKLMARIAAEREAGKVLADVLWTSDVTDFYHLKAQGALLAYTPLEIRSLANPFADYDGSFTAARLATLGLAFNTRFVKEAPRSWQDAYKATYKGAYGLANPALSGTAYLGVALLVRTFGWSYFEALHANGAKLGKGSAQLVEDTAAGDLLASLAIDYVVFDKIDKGGTLALVYPAELIVIPSPIAILKGGPNNEAAKKYVDFVLSRDGQAIIAGEGMLPVRADVVIPERYNLPAVADAVKRAAKIDYPQLMAEREAIIKHFSEIMQKDVPEKAEKR
ncbi:MAG: ABC transporter substrate-binding protein [Rhodocyclales bacterium]|nr:ABC transporter substrate-binding protein [Rhodocyclales bacterium]